MISIVSALRAIQAGLIAASGFVTANAVQIGEPYNWIATGAISIGLAIVSELVAGFGAKMAVLSMNKVRLTNRAGGTAKVFANNPAQIPWWWHLVGNPQP